METTNTFQALSLREKIFIIVFEADTKAGRWFDQILIVMILLSLMIVMLDSVSSISKNHQNLFRALEWGFTVIFTLEYLLRLYSAKNRWRYVSSFYGIVDILSVFPTYLAFFVPELSATLVVRSLRLLRVYRVFKLNAYLPEVTLLANAMKASQRKIAVFLSIVLMMVIAIGSLMYVIEGPENGFTSIPISIYWAITTMTTVGFGDITPKTDMGRFISSLMMLMGWGTLAVQTGIVTAELAYTQRANASTRTCAECLHEGIGHEDKFCCRCGAALSEHFSEPSTDS